MIGFIIGAWLGYLIWHTDLQLPTWRQVLVGAVIGTLALGVTLLLIPLLASLPLMGVGIVTEDVGSFADAFAEGRRSAPVAP